VNKKEFKKAIDFYRFLAKKEMDNEKIVNGTFIGPRSKVENENLDINDIIHPSRQFLGEDAGEDLDSAYVSTFRMGHFNLPEQLASTGQGTTFVGGMEFGSNLVKQKIVTSLDDLSSLLADYKIGILDVFNEKQEDDGKTMDIRVYECIECADLPNIGKPLCYFEAGIITGVFKEITKKDVIAEEKRCWTSGFSFCQFDVTIKD
jgi:uncharacterized protein